MTRRAPAANAAAGAQRRAWCRAGRHPTIVNQPTDESPARRDGVLLEHLSLRDIEAGSTVMVLSPTRTPIRVSLAAPDFLSLTGLRSYFAAQTEMVVLGDREEQRSDVLLAGANRIGPETLSCLREVATRTRKPMVLIVNDLREDELAAVLRCGVTVVLLRGTADGERVRQGVRIAASGGGFLPPRLFGLLINHLGQLDRAAANGPASSGHRPDDREIEVLRLLADGWDSVDIAEILGSSERTVKYVFAAIKRRYELRNRTHAVAYAVKAGWI